MATEISALAPHPSDRNREDGTSTSGLPNSEKTLIVKGSYLTMKQEAVSNLPKEVLCQIDRGRWIPAQSSYQLELPT
eukprot:4710277-Amphidinium_carterae.1